jgi:hypothetical protein
MNTGSAADSVSGRVEAAEARGRSETVVATGLRSAETRALSRATAPVEKCVR